MEQEIKNKPPSTFCKKLDKRFVNYILSRSNSLKTSIQTACFDTVTQKSMFASDFFFKPEELKRW